MEKREGLWLQVDGRVGLLKHKTGLRRTHRIHKVEEHHQRTTPQSINIQPLHGNEPVTDQQINGSR